MGELQPMYSTGDLLAILILCGHENSSLATIQEDNSQSIKLDKTSDD